MGLDGGLVPYKSITGASLHGTLEFPIVSGQTKNFFQGDLVQFDDTAVGTIEPVDAATDTPIVGVFLGCRYTNSDGTPVYRNNYQDTVTSEDIVASVLVDPFQLYKIAITSAADTAATLNRTGIGLNYDLEWANTANTVSGLSAVTLDTASATAGTEAQVRVVGLTNDDGTWDNAGSATTAYSHAIVMIDPFTSFWFATSTAVTNP